MRLNKIFLKIIPFSLLLGLISYFGFKSYFTYEQTPLVQMNGSFLKLVETKNKTNVNYHILLENNPNRFYVVGNGFEKSKFEWDVIFKDPLILLVSSDDLKKSQSISDDGHSIAVYEIRGPKETYLTKESSWDSNKRYSKVVGPSLGVFGLVGIFFLIYAAHRNLIK